MDFFASQEAARRSSRSLLVLFVLAIACIAALANLAIYLVLTFQTLGTQEYDQELMLQVTGAVLLLVLAGSVYRVYSLKQGGEAIAAALGAHLVTDGGADVLEQRLINVAEEMAIASGLPVPPVYLIDEDGINAFAAGFNSDDAVIGITRGALSELSRDELQGVVAHEFSHIIHGDMKLNIRLVGLLHGILMLSFAGKMMLQTRHGVARRSSGALPVMFIGLSLFLIGSVGKFFGDLIKAGVSRQREYLADASAVQYTRNNAGIAGALKRIGGYVAGSNVHHANADEFSHLYFSNSGRKALVSMLATHPPLEDRIKRLEPGWDGLFQETAVSGIGGAHSDIGVKGFAAGSAPVRDFTSANIADSVGTIQPVEVAHELLGGIDQELRVAVREPYSVRAVLYGLFLHKDEVRRGEQKEYLTNNADVFVRARLRELEPKIQAVEMEQRLPILELALPTLRQLTKGEYTRLAGNIDEMLKVSAPISLSEWALSYYLHHHMSASAKGSTGKKSIPRLSREIEYLLSVLAYSDAQRHQSAEAAFSEGVGFLGKKVERGLALQAKQALSIKKLERAIENLNQLKPLQKPLVLKALVAVIHADNELSPVEVELIRCIADAIDCPLPPLIHP